MGRYKQPYSLYKRGKYWYYRSYTPEGVRTIAKTTGKKNKTEARLYCESLYLYGRLYESNVTFENYAAHFYDEDSIYFKDRAVELSENTKNNYKRNLTNYLMPYFKTMKLSDISYSVLKQFRTSLLESGLKTSSVHNTMSILKHILTAAYRDDVIAINPFDKLEPISAKGQDRDAFTLAEVKQLYNIIGEEFQRQILLMALTGMRISEAYGVRYSDIKTSEGGIKYIDLKEQFNNKKYKPLKNKDIRPIPITEDIYNLLEPDAYDDTRTAKFYKVYNEKKEVFDNYKERLLSFHSLRHFFITNAKSSGVIESKVEFIAGHKLKKMASVYTNYKPDDLKEILQWQEKTYKLITE